MIVTTMDVENPSFSEPYGGQTMPLLSNMLGYSVTPYPFDFGIAGDTFDLTINESLLRSTRSPRPTTRSTSNPFRTTVQLCLGCE